MNHFPGEAWEWLAGTWAGRETNGPPAGLPGEEARALSRVQFLVRRAARGGKGHAYDVDRAYKKVAGRRRWSGPTARWAGSVAAIAGVLAIAYLSWPGAATRETGGGSPASRIVPGKARAELQLASGETIPLEGHGKDERWRAGGIVLENDTVAGRLKYGVTEKSARDETRYHTLYVPRGGEYQLELPDGTRVWINSKSSVRFPERFGDPAREVYLRGEAYFAVAKREGMPFRVHAGQQVITVTGTSFNASAYEDDEVWRTTLVEGSIRVEENGKTVEVRPSEQYVVERRQGRHRVEAVNSEWYTSWIDGRFYFKAFTFEELVRKLERWYDFRMIYEDEAIKGRRFTGFVNKHEPIERALALLEMTTSIQFHVVDKTITVKRK